MTDKEYLIFRIAKALTIEKLAKEMVHISSDEIYDKLNKKGLEDAQLFFRIIIKEVNDHNSKIETLKTRVNNLNYSRPKDWKSSLFKEVNFKEIEKAIDDYPSLDSWGIVKVLL